MVKLIARLLGRKPAKEMPTLDGWQVALAKINEYAAYAADWDGENAEPFCPQIIENAVDLIHRLAQRPGATPPSRVCASQNGSIVIEWQTERTTLNVEIEQPFLAEWFLAERIEGGQYRFQHWNETWEAT